MPTGNFWNLSTPQKPYGLFDADEKIDIPFDVATFMTGLGDTYASHTVTCDPGLEIVTSAYAGGFVTARVRKDPDEPLVVGEKYAITWNITGTSGQVKDSTLYLKIIERQV